MDNLLESSFSFLHGGTSSSSTRFHAVVGGAAGPAPAPAGNGAPLAAHSMELLCTLQVRRACPETLRHLTRLLALIIQPLSSLRRLLLRLRQLGADGLRLAPLYVRSERARMTASGGLASGVDASRSRAAPSPMMPARLHMPGRARSGAGTSASSRTMAS